MLQLSSVKPTLWIKLFLCSLILLALLNGCGNDSPSATQPTQNEPVSTTQAPSEFTAGTNLALELDLPGFSSIEANVFEMPITSFPLPFLSSAYAIKWTGSFTNGDVLAQTRSGKSIDVNPCIIPQGTHTITATAHHPIDITLSNPLVTKDIAITIDPGCETLFLEQLLLPSETNDGLAQELVIRVRLEDKEGELITDDNGHRPPVNILLTPVNGILAESSGTTDEEGYFRTTATLTENLGTMEVTVNATYLPDPDNTEIQLSATDSISMEDPCTSGDPDEEGCGDEDEDEEDDEDNEDNEDQECIPPPAPAPNPCADDPNESPGNSGGGGGSSGGSGGSSGGGGGSGVCSHCHMIPSPDVAV
ncbi:MAG: hypothetical protein HC921_21710 [Synechococcaceae cyanobacterium SM2_3_1]|nr:hypothetical protein [Synechococcaceae cyanobacterium SM2_3_1]